MRGITWNSLFTHSRPEISGLRGFCLNRQKKPFKACPMLYLNNNVGSAGAPGIFAAKIYRPRRQRRALGHGGSHGYQSRCLRRIFQDGAVEA